MNLNILLKRNLKAIQNEVSNFMEQDTFAGIQNKYLVRSLYFDNNIFTNFHEKIDGLKNRHKFRIRTYSNQKDEKPNIFGDERKK